MLERPLDIAIELSGLDLDAEERVRQVFHSNLVILPRSEGAAT
jgi:hypothetical protein